MSEDLSTCSNTAHCSPKGGGFVRLTLLCTERFCEVVELWLLYSIALLPAYGSADGLERGTFHGEKHVILTT